MKALLLRRAKQGPALVIAPTSVCPVWQSEAARFTPTLKIRLYRGSERVGQLQHLGPGDVLVTSYTVLPGDLGTTINNTGTADSDQTDPVSETEDVPVPTPNQSVVKELTNHNDVDGSEDVV